MGYWDKSCNQAGWTPTLNVKGLSNSSSIFKAPDIFIKKTTAVFIEIKDANFITNRDLDYILASIRIASYGDSISLTKKCESCENEDTFAFPLQQLLDHLTTAELVYETTVNEFKFKIRPLYYKEIVSNQQESVKLRRHLNQILSKLDDEISSSTSHSGILMSLVGCVRISISG